MYGPVSEYTPSTSPSFRVGLPRTVSGSVCLNAEMMTQFVNILAFGIDIVERRLSLYYVSAVLPIARD